MFPRRNSDVDDYLYWLMASDSCSFYNQIESTRCLSSSCFHRAILSSRSFVAY